MRKILCMVAMTIAASAFAGDVSVQGYTRADGRYVQGYHRTTPDNNLLNNYSTQGNTNPYTGQQGTVKPYPQQQIYTQPAPIYQPPPTLYQQPSNYYQPAQPAKVCPIGAYNC